MKCCVEYVWIDGCNNVRSKNRVITINRSLSALQVDDIPGWNYDGSSTKQATTSQSEIILKPVRIYKDPFMPANVPAIMVMCATYTPDGVPHITNNRFECENTIVKGKFNEDGYWFGFEQEFFIMDLHSNRPLGFPQSRMYTPEPQGPFYCSVGGEHAYGRGIVVQAYLMAQLAGLDISGMNGEVAPGQWEIQVGIAKGLKAGDDLWMLRYILKRVSENHNVKVEFSAKPIFTNDNVPSSDWNGSGLHTNFSTPSTRNSNSGYDNIVAIIDKLKHAHQEHLAVYGSDNHIRLTGKLETSNINEFTCSVGGRGVSVRIPSDVYKEECGYFEDRRPSSSADPYQIINKLVKTSD